MARKEIQELIAELHSWLPNYDHGPDDYPTTLYRILASLPGGDDLEDMGYEPMGGIGWQEADQLGRILETIQSKRDVQDLISGLLEEEADEDDVEEGDDEDDVEEESVLEESGSRGKPDHIEVYWDDQDSKNTGWAFRAHWSDGHEESGEIEGRSDMSDATLTSRARAAVGYPGTRIPVRVHGE